MACILTSGRTEPCYDAVGGLNKLYLLDYVEDAFTVAAGEATGINVAVTEVFEYDLKADGNNLVETVTTDKNNGTSINAQVLSLALKKQTKDSAAELSVVTKARPIAVVKDRMNNYKIVGLTDGCVVSGVAESGGAKADFNGYNLTCNAEETELAPYLDAATITALLALVSATNVTP